MSDTTVDVPPSYYVQGAIGFHRQSSYGNFPEPRHPALMPGPQDSAAGVVEPGRTAGEVPAPVPELLANLTALLARRASHRVRGARLSKTLLADCLRMALAPSPATRRRPYASAGNTCPITPYLLVQDVPEMEPGLLLRWDPDTAALLPLGLSESAHAGLLRTQQLNARTVQAVVLLVADLQEIGARYGERSYRYALVEAGQIAQNLSLVFTAAGVAHCPVGGFDDVTARELLGARDPSEAAFCVHTVALP